jgi:hypothetical protein
MSRLLVAAAVVALAAPAAVARPGPGATANRFQLALPIAQKHAPNGQLISARLEQGGSVFGFYFFTSGSVVEVELSASSFAVIKTASTKTDKSKVSADVIALIQKNAKEGIKLPEGRLLEIAGETLKDTPFTDLSYGKSGDTLVFTVGGKSFDAQTGQPVETPGKAGK